jgi:tRNA pseudouridine32 synthase/23S rRNA pseudouridine746 synthase
MGRSRLYLRKLDFPPATILEHLIAHFPNVSAETWRERVERGRVTVEDGGPLLKDAPYQHGITIYYERETAAEPPSPESETILYRDAEILVADKPHGMPVTPAGEYVERSLLFRLQQSTGVEALSPIHRLDRETAGLVLFSVNTHTRADYHRLFAKATIAREYLAIAQLPDTPQRHWRVENRIEDGTPWFVQRIVDGIPNAVTAIELLDIRGNLGLFLLNPKTGKKHQLRVHMASIGAPILGDPFYPQIRDKHPGEPPLQLLAHRLTFTDPLNGAPRRFQSARTLGKEELAADCADYADLNLRNL